MFGLQDEIGSPLADQLFEFWQSELFPETLQNSELTSSSNNCNEEQSCYPDRYNTRTVPNEMRPPFTTTSAGFSTSTAAGNCRLPMTFDPTVVQIDNDIPASIDFSPTQYLKNVQEPFTANNQFPMGEADGSLHQYGAEPLQMVLPPPPSSVVPLGLGTPFQTGYEEDCAQMMGSVPSYMRWRTNIDPMIGTYSTSAPFSAESSGIFTGIDSMLGTDISHQELEFQGENASFFLGDSIPQVFNGSSDLQALSSESQYVVHEGTTTSNANLTSEISSFDDPIYKVAKLSVEERRRKIHRYLKKRNQRNFSKKIKYACRKTLADSRPRVRGRFAKNDGHGRTNTGSNQEYDTDEDLKEEEDLDKSDIFMQIRGINSLKCNYPIQSWI